MIHSYLHINLHDGTSMKLHWELMRKTKMKQSIVELNEMPLQNPFSNHIPLTASDIRHFIIYLWRHNKVSQSNWKNCRNLARKYKVYILFGVHHTKFRQLHYLRIYLRRFVKTIKVYKMELVKVLSKGLLFLIITLCNIHFVLSLVSLIV